MTDDQIKAPWKKVPFRPFVIRTGSGESYPVNHPGALSFTPSGRTLSVWLNEVDQAIIDVASINEFVVGPSARETQGTEGDTLTPGREIRSFFLRTGLQPGRGPGLLVVVRLDRLLRRVVVTDKLAELSRTERTLAMRGAFRVR